MWRQDQTNNEDHLLTHSARLPLLLLLLTSTWSPSLPSTALVHFAQSCKKSKTSYGQEEPVFFCLTDHQLIKAVVHGSPGNPKAALTSCPQMELAFTYKSRKFQTGFQGVIFQLINFWWSPTAHRLKGGCLSLGCKAPASS